MSDVRITCTNKSSITDHESISLLGGAGGQRWTKREVVALIEQGVHTFHTEAQGYVARVRVYQGRHDKYVKTERDPVPGNNLLKLPGC